MTPVRIVITIAVFLGALCLLAIALLWPQQAHAQVRCQPLDQLLAELQIRYEEFPLVTADIPGLKKMITVSRDGTFTEINVMPNGTGCITLSGVNFRLNQGT